MSLYVDQSSGTIDPTGDLFVISWDDGNFNGNPTPPPTTFAGSMGGVTTIPVQQVTYPPPGVTTGKATANRLFELVTTSSGQNWAWPIIVTALSGGNDPYTGIALSTAGGGLSFVDMGVTPNIIHAVYDTSQDGGSGYAYYGTVGGHADQAIDAPNAVILYHELSHSYHHAIAQFPFPNMYGCSGAASDEPAAETDENVLRGQLGLCQRDVCNHSAAPPPGSSCGGSAVPNGPAIGTGGTSAGSSTSSGGCFIVTAAYGTETAPEVELLQGFRDNVLLRTRWGSQLFQELWKYYYRVSPAIAGEMSRDPELRRVLSFAIVEPWVNYMKLMMARPDFKGMNLDGLDSELRAFLQQFQGYGDKWIKGVELPKSFQGRDPEESVDELNMVLSMVLLRTDGRAYLDDLERRGELPLQYPKETEAKLRSALTEAGRNEDEVASILYGTKPS